jgi:hypothetical protein
MTVDEARYEPTKDVPKALFANPQAALPVGLQLAPRAVVWVLPFADEGDVLVQVVKNAGGAKMAAPGMIDWIASAGLVETGHSTVVHPCRIKATIAAKAAVVAGFGRTVRGAVVHKGAVVVLLGQYPIGPGVSAELTRWFVTVANNSPGSGIASLPNANPGDSGILLATH